jgi:hypothetical protein
MVCCGSTVARDVGEELFQVVAFVADVAGNELTPTATSNDSAPAPRVGDWVAHNIPMRTNQLRRIAN